MRFLVSKILFAKLDTNGISFSPYMFYNFSLSCLTLFEN